MVSVLADTEKYHTVMGISKLSDNVPGPTAPAPTAPAPTGRLTLSTEAPTSSKRSAKTKPKVSRNHTLRHRSLHRVLILIFSVREYMTVYKV